MANTIEENEETEQIYRLAVTINRQGNIPQMLEATGRTSDLPDGTTLADIVDAIQENGHITKLYWEEKKKTVIPEENRLSTTELSSQDAQNEKGKDKAILGDRSTPELSEPEKKRNKLGCFPILLVPILIGGYWINGMTCMHEEIIETSETIAITIEDERNPGIEYATLNGMAGQEKMTNGFVIGDGRGAYSCQEQADEERISVETQEAYRETTLKINDAIAVIENPNSTQDEIEQAINDIETQYGVRISIRDSVTEGIRANAKRFTDATYAHPDERSDAEAAIVEEIVGDFFENTEADKADMQEVKDLGEKIEDGAQLENWTVTENEDGDYVITAEEVSRVVKITSHKGIDAFLCKLEQLFRNLTTQKSANRPAVKKADTTIVREEGDGIENAEGIEEGDGR